MSTYQRIALHGLLAALPLALIGFLLSHAAGTFAAATGNRNGDMEQAQAITDTLASTLPYTLALGGFVFVLIGELLRAVWHENTAATARSGSDITLPGRPRDQSLAAGPVSSGSRGAMERGGNSPGANLDS